MVTQDENTTATNTSPKKILISQARPDSDKSPYFELERKHKVKLVFYPFIKIEGITPKEFRKQKIDLTKYTSIIFTSRNAIDHYFRMNEEMRRPIDQEIKYFCTTESVALYLQKFILYRKRKIFFGASASNKSLFDIIKKHRDGEKFLYVCSENQQDNDIVGWLKTNNCDFSLAFMYRGVSNDVKTLLEKEEFDVICLFTPSGIRSLLDSFPDYKQNGTILGAFGENTTKAVTEAGLKIGIIAPNPQAPSMVTALDKYLSEEAKNKA